MPLNKCFPLPGQIKRILPVWHLYYIWFHCMVLLLSLLLHVAHNKLGGQPLLPLD